MKTIEAEYIPIVETIDGVTHYEVEFKNSFNELITVEINEDIFLQIFGLRKTIKKADRNHHYIYYENLCQKEVSKETYDKFQSFLSIDIRNKNIKTRYIENFDLTEENLYHRSSKKQNETEDIVFKSFLCEEIQKAINTLKEPQRRRFILYYDYELTYKQISQIEKCSIASVKESIDRAKNNLKDKLKYFKE